MSNLTRDTVLERLPELRLVLGSDDTLQIFLHGRVVVCGTHGLSVLEAFASPTRLADALSQLSHRTRGAPDWIELTGTIERLYADGVLRRPDGRVELRAEALPVGFGAAEIHARMLNDTERTGRYIEALEAVVRPGDTVVDIGTGTGILALAAARAGASRVYAIEASWIGRSAQDLFQANGYAERIRLIRGWSTQLELPERVDILVSEVIGNDPLGERVLEITLDARRRLLKSDARLVPARLRIYGLAVTIPPDELRKRSFSADNAARWRAQYGFDFDPLIARAKATPQSFMVRPHAPRNWSALAQPVLLSQIDLAAFTGLVVDHTESTEIAKAGRLDGVVVFFELELAPGVRYTTDPAQVDERCSWRSPVWVFADPLEVEPGDRVAMTYTYGIAENWGRVHVARV